MSDTFFPDMVNVSNDQPFDRWCAVKLRKCLTSKNKVTRSWRKSVWAKEFAKLRKVLSDDQARIENVLDWYCQNIGREFIPEAFCAASFRNKFIRLESAYKKFKRVDTSVVLHDVSEQAFINEAHRKQVDVLLQNLRTLGWPKNSGNMLQSAIFKTVNSFVDFRKRIREFVTRTQGRYALSRTLLHKLDPISTTNIWFRDVHGRVSNWQQWNGQLMLEAWDGNFENKHFTSLMCKWSTEYSGSATEWFNLANLLFAH